MSSSATHTTSNLARFRAMIEQWEASQPPPQPFTTKFDQVKTEDALEGVPSLKHGAERDGKDVIVAFRTRPPLEGEAKRKFVADPNFMVKDAKTPETDTEADTEAGDVDFCPGISVRTTEPGVMVAQVPGLKWSGPTITPKSYEADLAFSPDISNDEVYARTIDAHDMINLVLGGGVGCVLAYGQTGGGKTYTMEALEKRIARDIFPAAEALSKRLRASQGQTDTSLPDVASLNIQEGETTKELSKSVFQISATFIEILGKKATDLLAVANAEANAAEGTTAAEAIADVPIMENKLGEVKPPLLEPTVNSAEELSELIVRALSHRRTSATARNAQSSRSHALLTLCVKNTLMPYADEGLLILVDLAGSERYEDSKLHDKQRMKESRENNEALMNLKECVRAKAKSAVQEEGFVHIPYRASKLTMLLKPIFDLESRRLSKTIVIAHVSPFIQDAAHSANTLSYASPFKTNPPRPSGPAPYDEIDPRTWDTEQTRAWFKKTFDFFGKKKYKPVVVDVEMLVLEAMTARNIARLYASEWLERCLGAKGAENKADTEDVKSVAMDVYGRFHYMLMRAKTRTRKEVMKSRKHLAVKDVYGGKPWEQDDQGSAGEASSEGPSARSTLEKATALLDSTSTTGSGKPPASAESSVSDTDWMILVLLHYEEVTGYVADAMKKAAHLGWEAELMAKEAAIVEMYNKYKDELEEEKKKAYKDD